MTKAECLECLLKDMEMLRSGEWVPDDDSIDAHIEMIHTLIAADKE